MNVFELKLKVYLFKDIKQEEALNQVASFIDEVLSQNDQFLELHKKNCYKNYVFCAPYPMAQGGIYERDKIYTIIIRTIESDLALYFEKKLANHQNETMKGIKYEVRIIPRHMIEKVYSLTPVLLKDPNGYWKQNMSFEKFEERLKVNLIKKYNAYTGDRLNEDFPLYTMIKLLNISPIKIPYKGISLLGDKIELQVSEHPTAQKLIYMGLGTGFCESNSRGYGYVNYQYCKEG